ncbi:hypothetical protein GCM10011313_25330 [Mycetocola zhadangensis]|nr:hypothetical protein GCM10011313_25330 [Mycetocola zhadangensis]
MFVDVFADPPAELVDVSGAAEHLHHAAGQVLEKWLRRRELFGWGGLVAEVALRIEVVRPRTVGWE